MLNENMKTIMTLCLLLLLASNFVEAEQSDTTELNKTCPAQQLCPDLEKYYQVCRKNPTTKSCMNFIETMKKLSPVYDCSRSFDKGGIVPAIWLCGENRRQSGADYTESYYELLFKLKIKEAKEYFASPLFRSVLDGSMAEEYYDKSKKLEKKLQKNK